MIVTLIALIIFIPGVNAKEIDISNLELHELVEVEAGDKIIFDVSKRNYDYLGVISALYGDGYKILETDYDTDHYLTTDSYELYEFYVKSYDEYDELADISISQGKRIKITLSIYIDCGFTCIGIRYNLVDDTQKKVTYNNTFDATNDNPESYYKGETDILLKDIKREGYKFLGWYKTSDFKEDSRVTVIDKDAPEVLELYAKWEKVESQVKENIKENPNTYTTTYVIVGIYFILMLSTIVVYVYEKKQEIK